MAPWAGHHLVHAGMKDTVDIIVHALNVDGHTTPQKPSQPLTNSILLDLYLCAKHDKQHRSIPTRLVQLLHALGYVDCTTCEKKWLKAATDIHGMCVSKKARLPKGVSKAEYLARVRADCFQPGAIPTVCDQAVHTPTCAQHAAKVILPPPVLWLIAVYDLRCMAGLRKHNISTRCSVHGWSSRIIKY